jgi:hypothetical protein
MLLVTRIENAVERGFLSRNLLQALLRPNHGIGGGFYVVAGPAQLIAQLFELSHGFYGFASISLAWTATKTGA